MRRLFPLRPDYVFLVLGYVFGLAAVFIVPPLQVNDEFLHFGRTYEIAHGKFMPSAHATDAPQHIAAYIKYYYEHRKWLTDTFRSQPPRHEHYRLGEPFDPGFAAHPPPRTGKLLVGNARMYPALPYFGHVVGLWMAKHVSSHPAALFYAGRIGGLIGTLALCWLAIRLLPHYQWFACFLLLTPMTIVSRSGFSADGVTIAFAFLTFAAFMRASFGEGRLQVSELLLLALLCGISILCKPYLIVLILLYLCIPKTRFLHTAHWLAGGLAVLAIPCFMMLAWWYFISADTAIPLDGEARIKPGIDIVLHAPLNFIYLSFATLPIRGMAWLSEFVGALEGWRALIRPMPGWSIALYLGFAALVLALDSAGVRVTLQQRLVALATVVAGYLFMTLLFFLISAPVTTTSIPKIQGRYFLPFIPMLALIVSHSRHYPALQATCGRVVIVGVCIMSATFLGTIYRLNY